MGGLRATAAAAALLLAGAAQAAEAPPPPAQVWTFQGLFGAFDRGALQRGFNVYKDACAACHGMRHLSYRHLSGIGFTEDQIRDIAAGYIVPGELDDQGMPTERPGVPADRFVQPFPNEQAARAANNGALPPDLSLMTKAHAAGPDYVHGVLIGYRDEPPPGVELMEGMYFNEYFPGQQIAMPPPLHEGAIEYPEAIEATVEQMARDVTTFLAWAAEPELEERKRMGVRVVLFLLVLTGLLYAIKRKVWADVAH